MAERFSRRVKTTAEYDRAVEEKADRWVAACGGVEEPFVHQTRTYLYVFNPASGEHGYLDIGTDIVHNTAPWEKS